MTLTVFLSKAVMCLATQCWPVLVGTTTPVGEYQLVQRLTADPGYGGDVLQFHETETLAYSIHRTWTLRPEEKREARYSHPNPRMRVISKGCINVEPAVYNQLAEMYLSGSLTTLIVKP